MPQGYYPTINIKLGDVNANVSSTLGLNNIQVDEGYYPTLNLKLTDELNNFDSNIAVNYPVAVVGYMPTLNINLLDELNRFTGDLDLGGGEEPPEPPVEDNLPNTRSITSARWQPANNVDTRIRSQWQRSTRTDSIPVLRWGQADQVDNVISLIQERTLLTQDRYILNRFGRFALVDNVYRIGQLRNLVQLNKDYNVSSRQELLAQDSAYKTYYSVPPAKDVDYTFKYNHVRLQGFERETRIVIPPVPPVEVRPPYIPNVNIPLQGVTNAFDNDIKLTLPPIAPNGYMPNINVPLEAVTNTFSNDIMLVDEFAEEVINPDEPIIEIVPGALQPTGSPFKFNFERALNPIDVDRTLTWGYGINNFVIGGVTTITSRPDPVVPPEPDPPIVHINYEVYRVVNTVNITVRPSGQFLDFENFTITRDVESFAWTCTFDLLTEQSYNLVRPVGRALQTIDININGTIFTVFVGKANTSIRASTNGTTRVYRCTAWSNLKRLSYPYARRRSFTDSQARTAAQIATNELAGTGFTVDWQTVDWQVPVGVHTYQNKTSLGAVLGVVNGVGGVIVPDLSEDTFTVRPYYPVSPWNWDDEFTQINRQMNESQFFSIDNDTIPRDNPNGVYVYGQEQGVGVFAVRLGTSGSELLPDVVDRYITANTAGQERGRIEVARNSFIELIPMSTYIDENGIIMPQELIEFTALDGTTWRGMVVQTTVNCSRVGTALTQQITIARFFDG